MKSLAKWTWLVVLVAVLYSGWVLYQRRESNRSFDEEAARERTEADRKIVERLGGGALKILTFYPNPPVVGAGGRALLCYGVAGAKSVRIEPAVESITPSLSRCIEIHPKASTQYKLIATDEHGREDSRTTDVTVR